MINLNVNRIEARLNRPGPNLITPVHYLVIGGGWRGSGVLSTPGGQSGEFNTGILNFQHETTATFSIGRGALGVNSTTPGLSSAAASSSLLDYTTDSVNIVSLPGSQSAADCNPGDASDIYPCNEKGSWIHDPTTYYFWAQDGGKSYDVPATGNDLRGYGGGQYQGAGQPTAEFPFGNSERNNTTDGYNGTGAGGGSGFGAPPGQSGDGGNGVVGLAIYDPNEIFDVDITVPTRGSGDGFTSQTIVKWEGYRIWYFHGTYSGGSFTISGRKQ